MKLLASPILLLLDLFGLLNFFSFIISFWARLLVAYCIYLRGNIYYTRIFPLNPVEQLTFEEILLM